MHVTRPSNISRYAPWTAFPSLVLRMAAPLLCKTINKKSAVVGGVKFTLGIMNGFKV